MVGRVETETEQGMADVLVEVIDEELEAQEDLVELVELEVQDHHSRRLPPDPAALADQERRYQAGEHPLSRLGRPHCRGAAQTH